MDVVLAVVGSIVAIVLAVTIFMKVTKKDVGGIVRAGYEAQVKSLTEAVKRLTAELTWYRFNEGAVLVKLGKVEALNADLKDQLRVCKAANVANLKAIVALEKAAG